MAEAESKSWIFLKSVGGISGAVITAVLIYHFTHPPDDPKQPTIQPVAFNGLVSDAASHQLLRNASVTVALGPNKVQQFTDASGRYSVVLAATSGSTDMGSVAAEAKGYQPFSNSVPLHPGDNFAEITLDAVAPPPTSTASASPTPGPPVNPGPGAGAVKPTLNPGASVPTGAIGISHAAIIFRPPPPNYVKQAETKYVGVKKQ